MPIKVPWEAKNIDVANIASKLPEPFQWAGGAALEGLRQLTGIGSDDPNQVMTTGAPMMAAESEGPAVTALKGLYSRVSKVADQLPEWVHPAKALSLFRNNASKEEMDYRGLTHLLDQNQGPQKMSKVDILQHLEQNPTPDVRVKTLGIPKDYSSFSIGLGEAPSANPIQYNRPDLNLPGGKNYTESLFKLNQQIPKSVNGIEMPYEQWRESKPDYVSSHWNNEPNVLAHTREDIRPDSSGVPGKFLQEVQSDWHQSGKEHGYRSNKPPFTSDEHAQAFNDRDSIQLELLNKYRDNIGDNLPQNINARQAIMALRMGGAPEADIARLEHAQTYLEFVHNERGNIGNHSRVPDAPFKDTWPDLTLKKHVMDVANDPNLDWLGFTKGETQAKRYNLGGHVSHITYDPQDSVLRGMSHTGDQVFEHFVEQNDLPNWIGQDVSQRLLASPVGESQNHYLGGVDLQMGGTGMKHFYDQLLPSRLNKILKPFGGGVEEGAIQTGTKSSIPLTIEHGGLGRVYDERTGEQLAQALPHRPGVGWNYHRFQNQDALVEQLKKQYASPETSPAWLARFTPEMKAEILKKGLPLLSLMGLMQPVPSHEQGQ